ncbi:hypothetical protein MMYC01_201023 [Madurella mycetomatis]|uniref:Uncharacterized protein n=1 Tax=Madurella mycetomatis TaxID=100816 RepID=A0A175WDY0_9PEZI|nr:hypothetical protein MMYC01_201023 [Madurella mycetomatis]
MAAAAELVPVSGILLAALPRTTSAAGTAVETSSTLATTATATASVPPQILSVPSPAADIQRSAALSGPSVVNGSGSNGMTISGSALVGIVVGCAMVAIFVALAAGMWWGRHQREKHEKYEEYEHAERLASSRGVDAEHMSPGLGSVFSPMAQERPGSSFNQAEGMTASWKMPYGDLWLTLSVTGRMSKGESLPKLTPLPRDSHLSHLVSLSYQAAR